MRRLIQVKLSQATVLIIDHPTKYGRPDKTISKLQEEVRTQQENKQFTRRGELHRQRNRLNPYRGHRLPLNCCHQILQNFS